MTHLWHEVLDAHRNACPAEHPADSSRAPATGPESGPVPESRPDRTPWPLSHDAATAMNVIALRAGQHVQLDRFIQHARTTNPDVMAMFFDRIGTVRGVEDVAGEHVFAAVDFGNGEWHGPAFMLRPVFDDA